MSVIAVIAGLLVLEGFHRLWDVLHMASPVVGNKLTGIVVGREFTPFKERQVSFNGRKIEGVEETDGEYVLKVRVDAMHKTYDVPVEKPVYQAKKDGDSLAFIRPPSEQRLGDVAGASAPCLRGRSSGEKLLAQPVVSRASSSQQAAPR